jgi:hypothetical protein
MWILLTQNVAVLPNLRLDQWQCLFDIIAVAASSGSFAAIKSFEVNCFILLSLKSSNHFCAL